MHFYCNVHADVTHVLILYFDMPQSHVIWYRQPVIISNWHILHPPVEVTPSLELLPLLSHAPPMPRSQNFMQIPREARPLCLCNQFVVVISVVICDWICFIGVFMPEWKKSCSFSRRAQYPDVQFPRVEAVLVLCLRTLHPLYQYTTLVHVYVLKGLRQLWFCLDYQSLKTMLPPFDNMDLEMIMN